MAEPSRPPCILLVDDNPGELGLLSEAFASLGDGEAVVDTCTTGLMALAELQGHISGPGANGSLPDLLVLDIRMPLVTGPDILRGIRGESGFGRLRVVMITSVANDEDRAHCSRLGALEVLTKPCDFAGYLALARHLVELARQPIA